MPGNTIKSLTGGVWGESAAEQVITNAGQSLAGFLDQLPVELQHEAALSIGRVAARKAVEVDSNAQQTKEKDETPTPPYIELLDGEISLTIQEIEYLLARAEENAKAVADVADLIDWGELLIKKGLDREEDRLIIEAFSAVKRYDFLLEDGTTNDTRKLNIVDRPFPIGYGQTISQPSLVAYMQKAAQLERGHKVLDGGSGSGFNTALLAHIVGPKGHVIGIERLPQLVRMGQDNLAKYPVLTSSAEIRLAGHQLGLPSAAPFDRIIFSGQIKEEWLPLLIDQLSPKGGILVVPIASEVSHGRREDPLKLPTYDQRLIKVTRNGDSFVQEVISENVGFVPIVYTPTNGQASSLAKGVLRAMTPKQD